MKTRERMTKVLIGGALISIIVTIVVSHASAQCVDPPPGLVSWWPGDGNAFDIEDGNDGTLQGDATFAPGKVGEAFSFDGNGDYVTIPHDPALQPTDITVDAWIKGDLADQTSPIRYLVVDKSHGFGNGTGWALQGETSGGRIAMIYGNGSFQNAEVFSASNVLDDNWHFVAGTLDGSKLRIYVDGVLENEITYSGSPAGNNREVNIGAAWGGGQFVRFFNGLIDEVEIYNRALSASEIQAIFDAGRAGKCKPPCTLNLETSYTAGTLNLDFELGFTIPAVWKTGILVRGAIIPYWTILLRPIDPVSFSVPIEDFPQIGEVTVWTTLRGKGGRICSDVETVDTEH